MIAAPVGGSPPTQGQRTPMVDPHRLAVAFAQVLRGVGLAVPIGRLTLFVDALGRLELGERDHVYWAGRATLVRRPEDIAAYDDAFARFWLGRPSTRRTERPVAVPVALDATPEDSPDAPDGEREQPEGELEVVRYSAIETLRHKDFAAFTDADFAESRHLLAALRLAGPGRRSRRWRPSAGRSSGPPDLRRTVRKAMRTGGEPVALSWRSPTERPRRLVLLCDVSGSMEAYSRALLRFAHAAVDARQRVEVFALGTRLTRLSRQLHTHDPDQALAAVSRAVPDWSGGTRLGDGIRRFNDEWGVRGLARGATVVVLSDGWDRGDPAALGEQMGRLHRVAHRIIWVNPLKSTPGYAPLARGMAAALPWVDHFVEGHSLAALGELAAIITGTAALP
ncbi:MAG: VWA domain-containing protein [Acidimicrobiales bacterium]